MIHEEICTYEVCKLAKKKGFNEKCNFYYQKGVISTDGCFNRYNKGVEYICSAPTQSLLQRWLREVHNFYIEVGVWEDFDKDADGECVGTYHYWSFNILNCFNADIIYEEFDHRYDTYELALEDALKYALENLI